MATGSGTGTQAASSSTEITFTAGDLIKDAMRICGALASSETPTAAEQQDALDALNMLMQHWTAEGIGIWQNTEVTLTLVVSQQSYDLGPNSSDTTSPTPISRPLFISEARLALSGGSEIPMEPLSRKEYMELALKTTTGKSTQYYYDKQNPDGKLYLWPEPDSASDTVKFTARMPVDEMTSTASEPDFPQEWYHAIKYNLADAISLEYNVPESRYNRIAMKAAQLKQDVVNNDRLNTSIHFQIDRYGRGR